MTSHKHNSEEQYMQALKQIILDDLEHSRDTLPRHHYENILLQNLDYVKACHDDRYRFYFYDYDKQQYSEDFGIVKRSLAHVNHLIDSHPRMTDLSLTNAWERRFNNHRELRYVNKATHINFLNGILDRRTLQLSDNTDYFSFKTPQFNYISSEEADQSLQTFIDHMFNNWSDNDTDRKLLLMQVMLSALVGRAAKNCTGFREAALLWGYEGRGKTTFLKICRTLTHDRALDINMRQITNAMLRKVNDDTRLLVEDDAQTSGMMSSIMASRLKLVIEHLAYHALLLKDWDSHLAQLFRNMTTTFDNVFDPVPLLIQTSSKPIVFHRAKPFLYSRYLLICMGDLSHVDDDFKESLDAFVDSRDVPFHENLIHYLLQHVQPFDEFHKYDEFLLKDQHYELD